MKERFSGTEYPVMSWNNGSSVIIPTSDIRLYVDNTEKLLLTDTTATLQTRVEVDDTTDATSTTDGSLQTDGGLSVAKSGYFGGKLTYEHAQFQAYTTTLSIMTLADDAYTALNLTSMNVGSNLDGFTVNSNGEFTYTGDDRYIQVSFCVAINGTGSSSEVRLALYNTTSGAVAIPELAYTALQIPTNNTITFNLSGIIRMNTGNKFRIYGISSIDGYLVQLKAANIWCLATGMVP